MQWEGRGEETPGRSYKRKMERMPQIQSLLKKGGKRKKKVLGTTAHQGGKKEIGTEEEASPFQAARQRCAYLFSEGRGGEKRISEGEHVVGGRGGEDRGREP